MPSTSSKKSSLRQPAAIIINGFINAAYEGDKGKMAEMLDQYGDVLLNAQNPDGWTALMFAGFGEEPDIVRFLLERGADPKVTNNKQATVLMVAENWGRTGIVALLCQWFETQRCQRVAAHMKTLKEKRPVNPFAKKAPKL